MGFLSYSLFNRLIPTIRCDSSGFNQFLRSIPFFDTLSSHVFKHALSEWKLKRHAESLEAGAKAIANKLKWRFTGLGIVFSIGLGYLFFTGGRYSQLMGYFAYMSVACTLIPLPTPPYVIALGEVFHPGIVALVGAIGNCLAALAEYYSITWFFSRTAIQERIEANRTFQRFAHYFRRSAFVCLVFTGLTPIPFEAFRLAGILIRYNVPKYLLAVFLGRFPRYYSIALIGHLFLIPNRYLVVMFIVLIMILLIGVFAKGRKMPHAS